MTSFIVRRAFAAILLIVVVSLAAFVLGYFAPGDPGRLGPGFDRRAAELERVRLGLDRPLVQQLETWIAGMVRLDLGTSATYHRPVRELVFERAGNTAEPAVAALVLATLLGLPIGLLTGARPRGLLSAIVTPISVALVSCPALVGALALLLLAVRTGWISFGPGSLTVPVLALGLPIAAMLEQLQSRATADTLALPNLLAAAARGIPPTRLLWVHAARQSLRPVLGIYGIVIGTLFSGSLAVEYITAWPGLGRLMYDALASRDLFLVAGCALFGAACLAAGNLIADVCRVCVDPRVAIE